MNHESRFSALNISLPPAPEPKGVYTPALEVGRFLYVSGHLPVNLDGTFIYGKIGQDIDMEAGKVAARQVGLTILATLRHKLGSLNRISRVIKVMGLVNATSDFNKHPFVINGCSELFVDVFGAEAGIGVRSAFGVSGLPENVAVEIEAIFELTNE